MLRSTVLLLTLASLFGLPSAQAQTYLDDDFEDGDLSGWGNVSDWAASSSSPISGAFSLQHGLSGVAGESYVNYALTGLDLTAATTTWRFNLRNGNWDPSGGNRFWVYLAANEADLGGSTVDGYAVGVNFSGIGDLLTLWRVTDGSTDGSIVTSTFDWGSGDLVGVEVTRTAAGLWELRFDTDGGFDGLTSAGTGTDATYSGTDYYGLFFEFTSSRAGELWHDDVSIVQAPTGPTVQFALSDATVTEGDTDTTYDLTVTLTNADGGEDATVEVAYSDADGGDTATAADIDGFTTASLMLGPGNGSDTVTITITGDDTTEPDEAFPFDLSVTAQTGGVTLGSPSTFTLTVEDDDPAPLANNTLVISEFMANPVAVGDGSGEYVEVFNNTSTNIDLIGYVLRDTGTDSHTIGSSVVVPGGGFAVLCRNGDAGMNGGVACDYAYASFQLVNGEDEIILEDGLGAILDSLQYTGSWVAAGASTVYVGSPNGDNTAEGNWVASSARESDYGDATPTGDDGSPGTEGVHANLASPFGVAITEYCYAIASGAWSAASTWTNCAGGAPGAGDAAAILSPNAVTLSAPVADVSVVVVETGAGGDGTLAVEGSLSADVVTVAGALTVSGAGALAVGSDLSVAGTGLTTNGAVSLEANADNAGRIATLTDESGTITGDLTAARRYEDAPTAGGGSFRGVFAPLAGVTIDQLNDDFQTQGAVGSDFPDAQATLYTFDATAQIFRPVRDFTQTFDPDSGYVLYMFDFDMPSTWDVTGSPRSPYTLTNLAYSDNADATDDYNWVPQPFASPIDFRELWLDATNVGATFWLLDPDSEDFLLYNASTDLGAAGRYVAPFQSFVVQTEGASAVIDYNDGLKDPGPSPVLVGRGVTGETTAHVQLQLEGGDVALRSDQTYLVFYPEGDAVADPGDATRLYPFSNQYATLVLEGGDGRDLAMDARPLDVTEETFLIRVEATQPGDYVLSWPVLADIPDVWTLTLRDLGTGSEVDLRAADSYAFSVAAATAAPRPDGLGTLLPAARGGTTARFEIVVRGAATSGGDEAGTPEAFALDPVYPNPVQATATVRYALPTAADVEIAVYDVLGRRVAVLEDARREAGRHATTLNGEGLASGTYVVRFQAGTTVRTRRLVVLQ